MIIESCNNNIESEGVVESTKARIIASGQMIRLLSSGLYQDKIMAVLRELSANAIDAMQIAGTLESHKFLVHIPTLLEPWFTIRDYGTGLSDEGIKRTYINYGASTKSSSNDQIGGFGVGAKAPFSYTNSYVISSFYNGVKSVYNYGLGTDGIPELSKILETPTDEHNGLEIQVPVIKSDISDFILKATQLYQWFDYRPKTNYILSYVEDNTALATDKYTLYTPSVRNVASGIFVKMGGIVYKFDYYKAGFTYGTPVYMVGSNRRLLLHLNIGDVDITASREYLELTDRTKSVIEKSINDMLDNLASTIENSVKQQTTGWNKLKVLTAVNLLLPMRGGTQAREYKMKLHDMIKKDIPNFSIDFESENICIFVVGNLCSVHTSRVTTKNNRIVLSTGHSIYVTTDTRVIVVDTSINDLTRHSCLLWAQHELTNSEVKSIDLVFVRRPDSKVSVSTWMKTLPDVMDSLGNPEYTLMSDISKAHPVVNEKSAHTAVALSTFAVYRYSMGRLSHRLLNLPSTYVNSSDMSSSNHIPKDKDWFYVPSHVAYSFNYPVLHKALNTSIIYTVAKTNDSKLRRLPGGYNAIDYINENQDLVIYDITKLSAELKSVKREYTCLNTCTSNVVATTVISTLSSVLKDISSKVIGDTDTINNLKKAGLKFKVVEYKIPSVLRYLKGRLSVLTTESVNYLRDHEIVIIETMTDKVAKLLSSL